MAHAYICTKYTMKQFFVQVKCVRVSGNVLRCFFTYKTHIHRYVHVDLFVLLTAYKQISNYDRDEEENEKKNSSNIIFIVSARIVSFNVFAIGISIRMFIRIVRFCPRTHFLSFSRCSIFQFGSFSFRLNTTDTPHNQSTHILLNSKRLHYIYICVPCEMCVCLDFCITM